MLHHCIRNNLNNKTENLLTAKEQEADYVTLPEIQTITALFNTPLTSVR